MLANSKILKKLWLSYILFNKDLTERLLKLKKVKLNILINTVTLS